MDVVWVVIGVLLLLVTLLDAFLAVLNYDEAGLFVDRIVRAQWIVLRALTRRVGRRTYYRRDEVRIAEMARMFEKGW